MNQTISARQTAILASILLFANKILVLPSLLYEISSADGFFIFITLLATEFIILFIFFKIKTIFPRENFYQIIKQYFGIITAKLFYFLLILYFFFKILLIFNISYIYFHIQVYIDAAYYLFLFCFLVIMTTCVFRGIRPLARGAEFFYFLIISCLIFIILLSFANYDRFPLFFDSNPANYFKGVFNNLFCFGDMLVLFVIMDRVQFKRKDKIMFLRYVFTSAIILLLIYFMFYSIFGQTSFINKNAISDIITFSYRFIDLGRLDIIAIITVMFLSFLQLSVYFFAFCQCFMSLFSKLSLTYTVCVFDLAFVAVVASSIVNYLAAINLGTTVMCYFALVLHFVLPILVLCFAKFRRQR